MQSEEKVLDLGFVRFIEMMGGDRGVVDAARVTHGGKSKGEEADKKLINFLLANKHESPFEHSVFKFHVKAPLFVARQWFRHRIASYNEISARYTEMRDEFYTPTKFRIQAKDNKQGSVAAPLGEINHSVCSAILSNHNEESMRRYRTLLEQGVAKEMARMVLPVNLYTEWMWTVNARSLMNFISLRSEKHAQYEMRQYGNALWRFFAFKMPWTAEAFLGTINIQRYYADQGGTPGPCMADIPRPQPGNNLSCAVFHHDGDGRQVPCPGYPHPEEAVRG